MVLLIAQSTIQSVDIVGLILDSAALATELTHALNGYLRPMPHFGYQRGAFADLTALAVTAHSTRHRDRRRHYRCWYCSLMLPPAV